MANLNDIKLSSDDILKKQFRTKVKGFDPDEVDAYLDQVMADYDTFHQIIEDLYGQIGNLQRELMDAKQAQNRVQHKPNFEAPQASINHSSESIKTYTPTSIHRSQIETSNENQGEISTNMAIIQRISTLERKVYNLEQRVYGLQK